MTASVRSPSPQAQAMLQALQTAVNKSLEKKQKLGQYAVIWQDGKPILITGEALKISTSNTLKT